MKTDIVTIFLNDVLIKKETEKAYLIEWTDGRGNTITDEWVPKSQVEIVDGVLIEADGTIKKEGWRIAPKFALPSWLSQKIVKYRIISGAAS